MQIYYTVASQTDAPQTEAKLSLGGFKSSTVIPNSLDENMFGEISEYTVKKGVADYIGIILHNTTGQTVNNITAWFELDANTITKQYIAAVALSSGQMERISTMNSAPYTAQFVEANGQANEVGLGDLPPDTGVGIWIKREIDLVALKDSKSCQNLYELFQNGETLPTKEVNNFVINW